MGGNTQHSFRGPAIVPPSFREDLASSTAFSITWFWAVFPVISRLSRIGTPLLARRAKVLAKRDKEIL
jgi:hypothetical protein